MRLHPYVVKFNGQAVGGFTEVSGLALDTNVVDYRDGNDASLPTRKAPGRQAFESITLQRGVVHDAGFSAWLKQPRTRRHLTIERYDPAGRLAWSRVLMDCTVTEHQSKGSSAIDRITLTYTHHKPS